jgi:hypothetical protein
VSEAEAVDDSEAIDTVALLEAFDRDDPDLTPEEKETTMRFARDEEAIHFFTAEAGIGRRFIAHPESTVEEVAVLEEGARRARDPREVERGARIVSVRGRLPVGTLTIKRDPRSSGSHATIITSRVLDEVGE